jgi:O-antigen/teichoic acid export membrane protein
MALKRLAFNTLVYAIGPQIPKLVSIIMLPILTPHLSSRDYGIYGILSAYTAAFSALADLGLTNILSVSFYKYKTKYLFYWNKVFTFITLWSIPLAAVNAAVIYLVLPEEEKQNFLVIALLYCLPIMIFAPTKWVGRKFFQLSQQPVPVVAINIFSAFSGIAANYITIGVLKMGYLGWFIGGFIVSLTTFIPYYYYHIKRIKIKFDFKFNKKWIKRILFVGLPVLPHYYSVYLLNASDRLVLDWYGTSVEEIGIYSLAYTLGGYFALVGTALADATGPMYIQFFTSKSIEDEKKARNLTFIMQIGITVIAFLAGLWMKEVYQILIKNETLKQGYEMAIIILMSYVYYPMYFGPISKLQFLYKTNELWKISLLAGVLNIVLNLFFVPLFGIWAAVFSTFAAMMFLAFRGYGIKTFIENNTVNYYPLRWFVFICVSAIIVYFLKDSSIGLKICISIVISAVAVLGWNKYKKLLAF